MGAHLIGSKVEQITFSPPYVHAPRPALESPGFLAQEFVTTLVRADIIVGPASYLLETDRL
jgi:hypothetical protein